MKRSLIILLPALLALASCGTAAQYASDQRFPDGIYYRPQPPVELYSEEDFRDMAARNIASDSLKLKEKNYDDYGYSYYSPYYYYSPYWGYRGYAWSRYWDPFWDPYWDPYWGIGRYGYYGFYSPYSYYSYGYPYYGYYGYYSYAPYYPHYYYSTPVNRSGYANPGNYLTGGNNYRRSGTMATSSSYGVRSSSSSYHRSGSSSSSSVSRSSSGSRRSGVSASGSGSSFPCAPQTTTGTCRSLQASSAASSRHCSWVFGSPVDSTWAPRTMMAS